MSGDLLPHPPSLSFPDFSCKILILYLDVPVHGTGEVFSVFLDSPSFQEVAGRVFLVGRSPRGMQDEDWSGGAEVSLAWEKVVQYYTFDSFKEFSKAYEKIRHMRDHFTSTEDDL